MSHQDQHAGCVRDNSVYLLEALQWLLKGITWDRKLRIDCSWTWGWLVKAALLWAWSDEKTLTLRFTCAQRLILHLQAKTSQLAKSATSWQAFMELLRRHTPYLLGKLRLAFQRCMQTRFTDGWTVCGWVVFGVDGSDIDVPRTASNEAAFAAKKTATKRDRRKKKGNAGADKRSGVPQIVLTTLFHVGLHLAWTWRMGSRNESERGHLIEMLDELPEGCLICGDAGFVGYDLASKVLGGPERTGGRQLLVRVGANVRLLKKLGYVRERGDTVYVWPEKTARKDLPPLVFRLVVMQGPRHPVYLITSVTDRSELSDAQVIEIYQARWGIEVYHRHLKQTFGRRRLLCHSAANAQVELEWSLLGLWGMGLYATAELHEHQIPLEHLSTAGVLRAFRRMARDYLHPSNRRATLRILLRTSLLDTYTRTNKRSRNYARKKKQKTAGKPDIKNATKQQRIHARKIKQQNNP